MNTRPNTDRLFDAFPPVPTKAWEDKIHRDLGGADYAESLLWHTADGVTVRPYYRSEDMELIEHVREGQSEIGLRAAWTVQQNLSVDSGSSAGAFVRSALEGGVENIGLRAGGSDEHRNGISTETTNVVAALLSDIPIGEVGVHLDGGLDSPSLFTILLNEAERRSIDPGSLRGSLGFDLFSELARSGTLARRHVASAAELVTERKRVAPHVRLLQIGLDVYHEAGATVIQETALALACLSEHLVQLLEHGATARDVLDRLFLAVPVSTSFLPEIAKLRALRLLIPQVVRAFLPEEFAYELPIHAQTSYRSMTRYDPHTNLLRATTEAAAAVIGGCDVLIIHPFDVVSGSPDLFSLRLARNIQHILRHEANLNRVNDPAGGSYYLEALTDAIARRAWMEFQTIEEMGGLVSALDSGYVQNRLQESRRRIERDVATGRRVVVGTNLYPNPGESSAGSESVSILTERGEVPGQAVESEGDREMEEREDAIVINPLPSFREGEAIERVRLRTEHFAIRPSVLILPIGEPAMRSERAEVAANVFGCGGFLPIVPLGFDTLAEAMNADHGEPDVLVIAAADDLYSPQVINQVKASFPESLIGFVGSPRVSLEVDFTLQEGVDMAEMLRILQNVLAETADAAPAGRR